MTPDDTLPALAERILTHLRQPLEAEIRALNDDFQQHAEAGRGRAVEQAVEAAVSDARRQFEAQLERMRESFRLQLAVVRQRADVEVADTRRLATAETEGARRDAQSHAVDARRQASELAQARSEEQQLRAALALLQGERDEARRSASEATAARDALQHALDDVRHAAAMASEELGRAGAWTSRLADAVQAIDDAESIADVLERLTQTARSCAQRSAILMVRGMRVRTWRVGDFPDAPTVDLPVEESGLIAAAIVQRRAQMRLDGTSEASAALPSFALDDRLRDAVALPMVIGGEVVAVLYADAPRGSTWTDDRRWPLALDVVVRHASSRVEVMTMQRSFGWPGVDRTRSVPQYVGNT